MSVETSGFWSERVRIEAARATARSADRRRARHARRVNRRRMGLAAFVMVWFAVAALAQTGSNRIGQTSLRSQVVELTVAPGETLWSLAKRYGDPAQSIEERVDQIAQDNGMASVRLVPGQTLKIVVENPTVLVAMEESDRASRLKLASR